jgi:hypothetical protein
MQCPDKPACVRVRFILEMMTGTPMFFGVTTPLKNIPVVVNVDSQQIARGLKIAICHSSDIILPVVNTAPLNYWAASTAGVLHVFSVHHIRNTAITLDCEHV